MHSYVVMYGDIQYVLYSFVTPTCLHHVNNYNWRMNIVDSVVTRLHMYIIYLY